MKRALHIILLGLLTVCCTPLAEIPDQVGDDGRTLVPVTLNLTVAPTERPDLAGHDGMTKAVYDPDIDGAAGSDAEIKTILVLQFEDNGAGDKVRVGNQQFFDHWPLAAGENVALVASTMDNVIFVIANVPGEIPMAGGTTLSQFLDDRGYNELTDLNDLDGDGIWYSPNGGTDKYLRMSGSLEVDGVALGASIGTSGSMLTLKRNCAKVVVNLKNSSAGGDKIYIDGVRLLDVNSKYYYATNYSGFSDPWDPLKPSRIDDVERSFPTEKNPDGASAGVAESYVFYLPPNERGMVTNAAQASKNLYAPVGATRLCVYAHYGSPAKHLTYTYYLGGNLTDDFNLLPNHKYTYDITLAGKGDPATDSRVEHMDEITFLADANCYMLTPPTGVNQTRTFAIPVRRAAVFWNEPGTNMGVYGAGTADPDVDIPLTESTAWTASMVWNDVKDVNGDPVADGDILVGASGKGFSPEGVSTVADHQPFIRIRVGAGMKGNALVAVKNAAGVILWSWHLWVTDYDPYVQMDPAADTYIYAVPNGEIHRYADRSGSTLWASGQYVTAFMMDRNLGAEANIGDDVSYGLYYQYGRKDPFCPGKYNKESYSSSTTIRFSVHSPDYLVVCNYPAWTRPNDDLSNDERYRFTWKDPKFDNHAADACESGKSIYDPCPYGWQVPLQQIYFDFNQTNKWEWWTALNGFYYFPGGKGGQATKGKIFFPASGMLDPRGTYASAGALYKVGILIQMDGLDGLMRVGGPRDTAPGITFYPSAAPLTDVEASTNSVRCIRFNYTRPY